MNWKLSAEANRPYVLLHPPCCSCLQRSSNSADEENYADVETQRSHKRDQSPA